jgi:hypothetical protein
VPIDGCEFSISYLSPTSAIARSLTAARPDESIANQASNVLQKPDEAKDRRVKMAVAQFAASYADDLFVCCAARV